MLDFRWLVKVLGGSLGWNAIALAVMPGMTQSLLAQPPGVLPQRPILQQGTQLSLNGRLLAASWLQWQGATGGQLGISDMALLNAIGLQLLNTDSTALQPVQWFTPANQTVTLPTRLTATTRYLEITDFARQMGWQTAIAGSTLNIQTVPSRVVGVRQSPQPWGDRLVIELAHPAPWQTRQLAQTLQVTIDAAIDPTIAQQFQPKPGRFLSSVAVEPGNNQTRLQIGTSGTRSRVWSLSNPPRLVVDLRPDALVEHNILWAPGVRWRQQIIAIGSTRIPTVWLEVNPRQPGLRLQPILPNPNLLTGIAPLIQTASQAQVAAAINGGFFNRNRQLPLGAIRSNGQWLSGPILNRGAIAWDNAGNTLFGRFSLQETIITSRGRQFPLTHLNSGYLQAGIARYTPDWGPTYTSLSDGEIIVSVEPDQVISQRAIAQAGGSVPIPRNGYILVLRSNRSAAADLPPGSRLQLTSATTPPDVLRYSYILGAGPLLLQNQQIVLDAKAESFSRAFTGEQAPRSAIAQRADNTLLFVTAYTRLDGQSLTLLDIAQLTAALGAVNALNLDGGSSTTLFLGGQSVDRDPRTSARVHNGLGIFLPENP